MSGRASHEEHKITGSSVNNGGRQAKAVERCHELLHGACVLCPVPQAMSSYLLHHQVAARHDGAVASSSSVRKEGVQGIAGVALTWPR